MNAYDAHKAIRAGIANPRMVAKLAKCPTSAMERDAQATARLRIGCELALLAALVGVIVWGAL